jgi:hypothetical protein
VEWRNIHSLRFQFYQIYSCSIQEVTSKKKSLGQKRRFVEEEEVKEEDEVGKEKEEEEDDEIEYGDGSDMEYENSDDEAEVVKMLHSKGTKSRPLDGDKMKKEESENEENVDLVMSKEKQKRRK